MVPLGSYGAVGAVGAVTAVGSNGSLCITCSENVIFIPPEMDPNVSFTQFTVITYIKLLKIQKLCVTSVFMTQRRRFLAAYGAM